MTTNSPINDPAYVPKRKFLETKDSYRPSVPLSVYRELVKELQATQGQLESLELQNQQLRQNMEQALQSVQQLQQVIDAINENNSIILKRDLSQKKINSSITQSPDWDKIYPSSSQAQSYRIDIPPQSQSTEQVPYPSQVSVLDSQGAAQKQFRTPINGWILAIGIFLIVVMSCTGAFLVVNWKLNPNKG